MKPNTDSIYSGIRFWGWLVWIIAATFYFYEFVLQISAGVLVRPLSTEFHLDATSIGLIGAAYFYSYALMQLPAGILLDRFGTKKVLSIAVLFCVAGSFIMYGAQEFYWILIARFVTAIGSAFAFIGALKTAGNWFPPERFALLSGLTFTMGMLGAVFGEEPLANIMHDFGWRNTMFGAGIIGVILCAAFVFIFKENSRPDQKTLLNLPQDENPVRLKNFLPVFRSADNWKAALYGGLMIAPMLSIASLWGEKYLIDVYSYSSMDAAGRISLFLIGFAVGSPIAGWFSDKIKRRKPSMVISSIGTLISFICFFYLDSSISQQIFTLLTGFFTAFSTTVFALIREINPPKLSATAMGFTNLMNMIIGAVTQTLIGVILDQLWQGTMRNNARIYTASNYHLTFSMLIGCIVVALILVIFIKEPRLPPSERIS